METEKLKTDVFCTTCKQDIVSHATCERCLSILKIAHMWDIEKLERVKKIIDEIISLSKLDSGNKYGRNWEVF